jgi:tRNA dimethylallyltransferase
VAARELLVIVGPTASGKTDLALRLAQRHDAEIVSADSVQVYRRFEIGTGKPTKEQRAQAPFHLVDIVEPLEAMDAARWALLAERAIDEIESRKKLPIVCGGTFLWVRALLFGLAPAPPADEALRARYRERVRKEGRAALHAELARVDGDSAARLAPNDFVRVSRALEVFELTGIPLSRWHREHGFREPRFTARLLGIRHPRDGLDRRIAERAERMLAAGWIDEVRKLLAEGFRTARAMGSVGYKQILEALDAGAAIDEKLLAEQIVRATRVFARRQRTWLRDEPVAWLSPEQAARGEAVPGLALG